MSAPRIVAIETAPRVSPSKRLLKLEALRAKACNEMNAALMAAGVLTERTFSYGSPPPRGTVDYLRQAEDDANYHLVAYLKSHVERLKAQLRTLLERGAGDAASRADALQTMYGAEGPDRDGFRLLGRSEMNLLKAYRTLEQADREAVRRFIVRFAETAAPRNDEEKHHEVWGKT